MTRPADGRGIAIGLLVLLASLVAPVRADISLRWQNGTEATAPILAGYLVDSGIITDFVELVAANFAFEQPLVVTVGAASGPDYETATNMIRLPYGYVERALRAQMSLLAMDGGVGEEARAMRRALDVVEYTLLHLLGHALAGSGGIEVDERAEAWSTWAVLGHRPDGAAEWRRMSQAFADASRRLDGPLEDYWHAHGLHEARARVVDCWIVGREPDLAEPSRQAAGPDGVEACRTRWERLDADARAALAPILLDDAPLRRGVTE